MDDRASLHETTNSVLLGVFFLATNRPINGMPPTRIGFHNLRNFSSQSPCQSIITQPSLRACFRNPGARLSQPQRVQRQDAPTSNKLAAAAAGTAALHF